MTPGSAQEIRVVGRLAARVRVEATPTGSAIIGVLTDETGMPVAGTVGVEEPSGPWQSCVGRGAATASLFATDEGGRFCVSGPKLARDARAVLRFAAEGYRSRELELGVATGGATPPRWLSAPDVIELDRAESVEVRARIADDAEEPAMLELDCSGERTILGRARAHEHEVRFVVEPTSLPGPGSCSLVVRANIESDARPVVLRAPARLTALGWSTTDGRPSARIGAELHFGEHTRPLAQGLLEVSHDGRHLLNAGLTPSGVAELEFDQTPPGKLTIRLIEFPPHVRAPLALELAPPGPWNVWHVFEAGLLALLGLWLFASWRSDRRPAPRPNRLEMASRGARTNAIVGRIVDAHTGAPVPAADVVLLAIGTSSEDVVSSAQADGAGRFELAPAEAGVTRLRVSAHGYLTFEGVLSAREPVIRLATRRRAALGLFASWARGQEWIARALGRAAPTVPTPEQITRVARTSGRDEVAEWTAGVAQAAYGPTPPSDADLSALAERKPS